METRSEIRAWVYLAVLAVIGMIVAPDYAFFPVIGLVCLAGGAYFVINGSTLWGVLLLLAGLGFQALGLQSYLRHRKAEADEAAKAEGEITRRMGRGPRV